MIEVWVADGEVLGSVSEDELALLDEGELARHAEFRRGSDRRRFAISRILLRNALSHRLGGSPADWRFETDAKGKQSLSARCRPLGASVDFNLSHSGTVVAVAIAVDGQVGIDLERMDDRIFDLVESAFTPRERRRLESRSREDRRRGALGIWTMKEAYAKLLGVGLELEFSELETSALPPGVRVETRELSLASGTYLLSIAQNALVTEKTTRGLMVSPLTVCG